MNMLAKLGLIAITLAIAVTIHVFCLGGSLAADWELLGGVLSLGALAASFSGGPSVQDSVYTSSTALPSATNGTVTQAAGFDMEGGSKSDFLALAEGVVTAPALNTTQLPNAATMTYNLIASATPNLASPTTVQAGILVQTGAGGVGAAAASNRVRFPTNLGTYGRYVGLTAVGANSSGNCSAASVGFKLLF